jgi:hypothetical protein
MIAKTSWEIVSQLVLILGACVSLTLKIILLSTQNTLLNFCDNFSPYNKKRKGAA